MPRPIYHGRTGLIPSLLMPWLLASPGNHQPWYGVCKIDRSPSPTRKNSNHLRHLILKYHKNINIFFVIFYENSVRQLFDTRFYQINNTHRARCQAYHIPGQSHTGVVTSRQSTNYHKTCVRIILRVHSLQSDIPVILDHLRGHINTS